jgi:hypothetical protein
MTIVESLRLMNTKSWLVQTKFSILPIRQSTSSYARSIIVANKVLLISDMGQDYEEDETSVHAGLR